MMDRNVESRAKRTSGSTLSRRELLGTLAGAGVAAWAATSRGVAGIPAAEAAEEPRVLIVLAGVVALMPRNPAVPLTRRMPWKLILP